jgi:hypothetical protein
MLELAAIYFALGSFDAWLTRRRINAYGTQVELNPATVKLCHAIGTDLGVITSVILPVALTIAITVHYRWQTILAVLIGMRLKQFITQWQSIKFEKQLREFQKSLGPLKKSPPSTLSADADREDPIHKVEENG